MSGGSGAGAGGAGNPGSRGLASQSVAAAQAAAAANANSFGGWLGGKYTGFAPQGRAAQGGPGGRQMPSGGVVDPVEEPKEVAAAAEKSPLHDNEAILAGQKRNARQRRRPLMSPVDPDTLLGSSGMIFNRKDYGSTI